MIKGLTNAYSDTNVTWPNAFHVVNYGQVSMSFMEFSVCLYENEASFDSGNFHYKPACKIHRIYDGDAEFDQFFSRSARSVVNKEILECSYDYLMSLGEFSGAVAVQES